MTPCPEWQSASKLRFSHEGHNLKPYEQILFFNVDDREEESRKIKIRFGRTSVALILMARIPRLFRTRSLVICNKTHSCRFGII